MLIKYLAHSCVANWYLKLLLIFFLNCNWFSIKLCFIKDYRFNSKILSNYEEFHDLMKLCNFTNKNKWSLIYRASKLEFSPYNFHLKCDRMKNTLVLIKTTQSFVFGGYTEAGNLYFDWNNVCCKIFSAFSFKIGLATVINTIRTRSFLVWWIGRRFRFVSIVRIRKTLFTVIFYVVQDSVFRIFCYFQSTAVVATAF